MKNFWSILALAGTVLTFAACSSDDDATTPDSGGLKGSQGVYVLCEGSMGNIDGSLDFISSDSTVTRNVFSSVNGRSLGDTPNDALIEGDNMYIATNNENRIEVINKKTAKSVAVVNVKAPRCLAADDDNLYISSYTGKVYKMSLSTNELTDSSEVVGTNLEGIAVRKGHVYVSNGWNNDYTYNTNVVKLQAATLDKEKDIIVETNPGALLNTSDGLYLLSIGNYDDVPGWLQKIDDQDQVSKIGNYTMMAADENGLYLVNAPYGIPATYSYYSFATKTAVKWIDGTEIFNPYAIGVDSVSGKVYVTSLSKDENTGYASYVMDGYIVAYTTAGVKTGQWTVGVCPGVIVPLYSE